MSTSWSCTGQADFSTYDLVIELIRKSRCNLDVFITHRFKLDRCKDALHTIIEHPGEVIKDLPEID